MKAFIVDALRTPRGKGKPGGGLHEFRPVELVAIVLRALELRNELDTSTIDDLILGCVTQVGDQGANVAKIGALYAGWSDSVPGMSINRFCCSGLDALGLAAARLDAGMGDAFVTGGVESISRVPMLSDKGAWFADPVVAKKTGFVHMPEAADLLASIAGISREDIDAYAAQSHQRAARATQSGHFARSLVAVINDEGELCLDRDELIRPQSEAAALAKLPALLEKAPENETIRRRYPEHSSEHRHSIASSPGLADGAAALLVTSEEGARRGGHRPRARVRSFATHSVEPIQMLHGNVGAVQKAVAAAGLSLGDIDSFEVNESFAAVPLHFQRELSIPAERLNPSGGAIAMGHPLGATGGMLVATLLDRLEDEDQHLGVASICGGAGVATSVVIERL